MKFKFLWMEFRAIGSSLKKKKKRGVSEYEGRPKDITFEKEKNN